MSGQAPKNAIRRTDGLTLMALSAGLAIGHVAQEMSNAGGQGAASWLIAGVFMVASALGTLCALGATAAAAGAGDRRGRVRGWILAIGGGMLLPMGLGVL